MEFGILHYCGADEVDGLVYPSTTFIKSTVERRVDYHTILYIQYSYC